MEPAEMDRMLEFQDHLREVQYLNGLVTHLTMAVTILEDSAHEAQSRQSHHTGHHNLALEIDQTREKLLPLVRMVWQLLHQCSQSLWCRFGANQNHTDHP